MPETYEVLYGERFLTDFRRIITDPNRSQLRDQMLTEIEALRHGTSDGHHPLGYSKGKGDLRDCVASKVQSDPNKRADYRLVFREMPPEQPGGLPRRELLAIKPRHGHNGVYAHLCARLHRHRNDLQPGLNVFGDRPAGSGGNQAQRKAELDAKRAVAMAYKGQRPLPTSRPLSAELLARVIGPARAGPTRSARPTPSRSR
ncbi:hypothetical protein [Microlunatus soli]|uniref:Uncharacterized protein n=1 Tax=Microlunatus soli TaxID=630515 RepID=A0A1H1TRC5_9ACTN|nr:hypothetical protein [Microlunatus soli]SDS62823.1 hypothetical protein SAMN04489812_2495 [Microlunatus soli]